MKHPMLDGWRLTKYRKWDWRDVYRLPVATLILWDLCQEDLRLRAAGLRPDEWFWADVLLLEWGYGPETVA